MTAYDLVVRGGAVADGTGALLRDTDVAVRYGRIAAIGHDLPAGRTEIDARDLLVTPGFVDVHTHYDGQAMWDDRLQPSTQHGASTVVMGNCGVGFAPCRPADHAALISLMEGVEDIPGAVMAEGLSWNWETFPQYLDALSVARPRDADLTAFVPHGPVRVYVMGERAIAREAATDDDVDQMRRIVGEGLRAGAAGFSTSRTLAHRTAAGDLTPTYAAAHRELIGVGKALSSSPGAAFQMITDWDDLDAEFDALTTIVRDAGAVGTFTLLQNDLKPDLWRDVMARLEAANAAGASITGQAIARPIGVVMGLDASMHTFRFRPTYKALSHLPLAEKVRRLKDPATKAAILAETDENPHVFMQYFGRRFDRFFELGAQPDYLPDPANSIVARAQREGRDPFDLLYDVLLGDDGNALIYLPLTNFTDTTGATILEMLRHPNTTPALGDGGAHVGTTCDASVTTFLLTEWVRRRGAFTIEEAMHRLTQKPARLFRLNDRGVIAPGMKADLNVIDFDNLAIAAPRMAYDLPAGGKRLLQGAHGYKAQVVSGVVTYRDGVATGALPGHVLRGPQAKAA